MKTTDPEEVKAQVLRIKAMVDTALRQNINMKDERYEFNLSNNPGTGKTRCSTALTGLLIVNTFGKTVVARLYAKFLTSMDVLSGNGFVEISESRLANDEVAGAKKYIETLANAGGGAFFLDEAYQLTLGHNYIRLIEKGKNPLHIQETLTFLDEQRNKQLQPSSKMTHDIKATQKPILSKENIYVAPLFFSPYPLFPHSHP